MNINNSAPCLIFAHRGANKEAAENTRSAFNKALEYPIDGIETDVQLTRDEVSVLWHDRYLDKLGYPQKSIDDFDYAELEKINFAAYYSPEMKPEGVLSLQEFIDSYRGRCVLQIEIKNRQWESIQRHEIKMRQCLEIVGANPDKDIFISSFNLQCLIYAHQHGKDFPLYYAIREHHNLSDVRRFLSEQPFLQGLCMPIEILDDAITRVLRDYNKGVVTYTCNSEAQISKALNLGVDVLITDYPQKALQMRRCLSTASELT